MRVNKDEKKFPENPFRAELKDTPMAQATTNLQTDFGFANRVQAFVSAYREARLEQQKFNQTFRELDRLSDRELADIGIRRGDIEDIARAHVNGTTDRF